MKGILLLNGEPYKGKINCDGALVYCSDGAYNWAEGKVKIDKVLGDFDSVSSVVSGIDCERVPAEKDFTDGELGLERLIERGVDEIEIYGFGGGRDDHFVGNLQLLYKAARLGVCAVAVTNFTKIFLKRGRIFLGEYNGRTFSVFPFCDEVHINSHRGFKYDYPKKLVFGSCIGISNVVTSDDAYLDCDGFVLIFIAE